ncbi:MAG: hypothetical protein HQL55_12270, partial [Magnetococcales bacterium]|nr:hypothetical protein [Magnetococcales bacterium]
EIPDCDLRTHIHPKQLHQVVLNLCNNAAQAMGEEEGRLTVGLRQTRLEERQAGPLGVSVGSYLVITVQDTGPGIAPNILERIFEPFFTTKDVNKGVGLGLAMVHGAVRNWGGCVHVESTTGLGSTFMVYIPALDSATLGAETAAGG